MFSSIGLKNTSHKTVWKEESRKPVGIGMALCHPPSHEIYSLMEVSIPWWKGLLAWVWNLFPIIRHLILEEWAIHLVQLRTHQHKTLNGINKLLQRRIDDRDETVVSLLFLEEYNTVAMKQS
jgi:hypothetical protein